MSAALPLEGVRVLDLTWVGAGPIGTKIMAEFGAEVIKVESRTRPDPLRRTGPFAPGNDPLERSGYFADRNAGKQSISLDLTDPRARDVVLQLAAVSDVCAQSFRPGTMEKWGLGYEDLVTVRPDIIYLAMPMQGETGPHSHFSGFGATLVALCGLHELCGYPDREPVGTGTNYPDHVPNPLHAVFATLTALSHRARTGQGQRIELSQLESTINIIGPGIEQAARGRAPERRGNRVDHAAPHGVFPAAGDDRWVAIAVLDDIHWRALAAATDIPALMTPGWDGLEGRRAAESEIEAVLSEWTSQRDADEVATLLTTAGVPASVVRNAAELLDGASGLRARGAFTMLHHPVMGDTVYTAPTPRLSRTPGQLTTPAPLLGQHTDAVLRDVLGMAASEIDALRTAGVLT
ncbi:CoA transferase [Microbacterium sp. PI-1]|uniref:CaiB/BaiF CoA transferase family protein n=1 Tax=Microbacterium sp. PI-1 TaxID=2545631 RepID=UPI00103DE55D|nr:CoA transferase [Microbacterium sp. PI-1]TCJ21963.1 CoA transferase [Microbacterium sp. PI-1]